MTMQSITPAKWIDRTMAWSQIDFGRFNMCISMDRYTSREFQQRERELI